MANYRIPPDVQGVLNRSEVTENSVKLPPERLERKLYESVNRVLANAGGKWDRRTQTHLFKKDPRVKLGLALSTGVSVDEKKLLQAYYTPADLADEVARHACVAGHRVLEPSAGDGAIVACFRHGARQVDCIEVNEECRESLLAIGEGNDLDLAVTIADFLDASPIGREKYDRVVMNPPFAKNQDIAHVRHALNFLKPDGVLVALMFPNTERKGFAELFDQRMHTTWQVEPGRFKQSGTLIPTLIVAVTQVRV